MAVCINEITTYFDAFRKQGVVVNDELLDHVFAKHILTGHDSADKVPKEAIKNIISDLAQGKPCKLTQDQEYDVIKALSHHCFSAKIDLNLWKTCFKYWMREDTSRKSALLVTDVQNDFITGTLALKNLPAKQDGEDVVSIINKLKKDVSFDLTVFSLDWHPSNHCSYHKNVHKYPLHHSSKIKADGAKMYDVVMYDGDIQQDQTLWPVHCEQETWGAKLHPDLQVDTSDVLIYKGHIPSIDSYSAFWDNGKLSQTNLLATLLQNNITQTFICGLATDFCVMYNALDSAEHGFKTYFIEDASRGVADDSIAAAKKKMIDKGVTILTTDKVACHL